MSAISNTLAANILNATLPVATGGKPSVAYWSAGGLSSAGAMYMRLNSTAYSGSNPGSTEATQIASGSGYVTNGTVLAIVSVSSVVSNTETVTLPSAAMSWTNSGSGWTIDSLDITDNAQAWAWFGNFNGQPISIANGNTFQVAINAVTATLS